MAYIPEIGIQNKGHVQGETAKAAHSFRKVNLCQVAREESPASQPIGSPEHLTLTPHTHHSKKLRARRKATLHEVEGILKGREAEVGRWWRERREGGESGRAIS